MALQLNSIIFLSSCMNSVELLVIRSFFVVMVVLVNSNFLIQFKKQKIKVKPEQVFVNIVNRLIHSLKF